jgi:hypothetical protein
MLLCLVGEGSTLDGLVLRLAWQIAKASDSIMSNDEVDSGGAIAAAIISATQDNDILDTNDEAANLCDGNVCLLGTSDALAPSDFFLIYSARRRDLHSGWPAPSASSLGYGCLLACARAGGSAMLVIKADVPLPRLN